MRACSGSTGTRCSAGLRSRSGARRTRRAVRGRRTGVAGSRCCARTPRRGARPAPDISVATLKQHVVHGGMWVKWLGVVTVGILLATWSLGTKTSKQLRSFRESNPAPVARTAPFRPNEREAARAPTARAPRDSARSRAAHAAPWQEGSGRTDLDGDGVVDCWRLSYDGGNAYGSWLMVVKAPCESIAIEIRLSGSFGAFISLAPLAKALIERPRLLEGILAHWFGNDSRRSLADVDGSLAWLIESYTSDSDTASDDDWKLGRPYAPHWSPGAPVLPDLEAVTLISQPEQELGAKLAKQLAIDDAPLPPGPLLLVYFAHNHHKLDLGTKAPDLAVHTTDHAVSVEDLRGHRWSWIFVVTGQMRLRKPSIVRTATDGLLVAIEIAPEGSESQHQLIIVDPRLGRWASREATREWKFDSNGLQFGDKLYPRDQLAETLCRSKPSRPKGNDQCAHH